MSKNYEKLASRYARALLASIQKELGSAGTTTPAQHVARSLSEFAELWESENSLSASLLNPMFEKSQRLQALQKIADAVELPEIAKRFLRVVFERDRIAALPEIAAAFRVEADQAAGVVPVEVIVAHEIDSEEARTIESGLAGQIEGKLKFTWRTDPSLIGGMLVKYSGKVLDGSLSGRLARIERKLLEA